MKKFLSSLCIIAISLRRCHVISPNENLKTRAAWQYYISVLEKLKIGITNKQHICVHLLNREEYTCFGHAGWSSTSS